MVLGARAVGLRVQAAVRKAASPEASRRAATEHRQAATDPGGLPPAAAEPPYDRIPNAGRLALGGAISNPRRIRRLS